MSQATVTLPAWLEQPWRRRTCGVLATVFLPALSSGSLKARWRRSTASLVPDGPGPARPADRPGRIAEDHPPVEPFEPGSGSSWPMPRSPRSRQGTPRAPIASRSRRTVGLAAIGSIRMRGLAPRAASSPAWAGSGGACGHAARPARPGPRVRRQVRLAVAPRCRDLPDCGGGRPLRGSALRDLVRPGPARPPRPQ